MLDEDECALETHICPSDATCNNTFGSYTCKCNEGFKGNRTTCEGKVYENVCLKAWNLLVNIFFESKMLDKDECALEIHACHFDATCNNTIGSYTCTCNEGYTGNGIMCNGMILH